MCVVCRARKVVMRMSFTDSFYLLWAPLQVCPGNGSQETDNITSASSPGQFGQISLQLSGAGAGGKNKSSPKCSIVGLKSLQPRSKN